MTTQELLNIILAVGFAVIVGCILYTTYYFVQALKSVTNLIDSLEKTTENIKNRLGMKALALVPGIIVALVSRIFKKREVNK